MHTAAETPATARAWLERLEESRPAVARHYRRLVEHPDLGDTVAAQVARAYAAICGALERGGTFYLCGNGGSFADALHISGELLKAFVARRPLPEEFARRLREQPFGEDLARYLQAGLCAHVLGTNPVLASAVANDIPLPGILYAQELAALARPGDVFLGISTSGQARNVLLALSVARALGLVTIGLTGAGRVDNPLAAGVDIPLVVPAGETSLVQEQHIVIYHQLCLMVEAHFWGEG